MKNPEQKYNILAIAQPTEVERRQHLDEMLSALNMHYELVKTSPPVPRDQWHQVGFNHKKSRTLLGRDLSCGEIGCFLSHRAAWKLAAESDRPSLILEGDADLNESSRDVCEMLSDGRASWELAMLYYSKCIPSVWYQQRLDNTFRLAKFANRRAYCLAGAFIYLRMILFRADGSEKIWICLPLFLKQQVCVPSSRATPTLRMTGNEIRPENTRKKITTVCFVVWSCI